MDSKKQKKLAKIKRKFEKAVDEYREGIRSKELKRGSPEQYEALLWIESLKIHYKEVECSD